MRTLLHPARTSPVLQDAALLIARVAIGFILMAHGLQKFLDYTLDGTTASFTQMGIPVPAAAAVFAATVETVGGAALILGLLTPVVAALNILNLLGALVIVHADKGVFVDGGGYELVLALIAGLVVLVLLGAGRFSVDGLLGRRTRAA
ncbi:DoxX family protein [Clavibacter michiganensis]|uniref:DoxX family protein n=1 Tax=Clavibacter michiganensis TaxID=28447 RepID=UPI000CE751FC|nr:DoxX family protein [Clavibacter michiganensis]PPF86777.1 DoxX family protein [Clavibacter michiganensis]PPF93502.1 DoxX family protein [Clavibacter michiganensis]